MLHRDTNSNTTCLGRHAARRAPYHIRGKGRALAMLYQDRRSLRPAVTLGFGFALRTHKHDDGNCFLTFSLCALLPKRCGERVMVQF